MRFSLPRFQSSTGAVGISFDDDVVRLLQVRDQGGTLTVKTSLASVRATSHSVDFSCSAAGDGGAGDRPPATGAGRPCAARSRPGARRARA